MCPKKKACRLVRDKFWGALTELGCLLYSAPDLLTFRADGTQRSLPTPK